MLNDAEIDVIAWNGTSSGGLGLESDDLLCKRLIERHLGLSHNFSFSGVTADQLRTMIREVAKSKPQAITTCCTNLHGAPLVEEMAQHGVLVNGVAPGLVDTGFDPLPEDVKAAHAVR